MTTIVIAQDITATLTWHKVEQYHKAMEATANRRIAFQNENFDWEDLEDFMTEEWEAWEKFLF